MQSTNLLAKPGDQIFGYTNAGVFIQLQVSVDGRIARNVFCGTERIAELCTDYSDETTARTHTSALFQHLNAGVSVPDLIDGQTTNTRTVLAQVKAIVNAEAMQIAAANPNTVTGEREYNRIRNTLAQHAELDAMAAQIRSDLEARDAEAQAELDRFNQDMANLTGREVGGMKPRTIADTVPDTGETNSASVAAAPTSTPMGRILQDAVTNNGRIARSQDATSTQLIALEKRGLVVLTFRWVRNQRTLTGAQLTTKGYRHAGRQVTA